MSFLVTARAWAWARTGCGGVVGLLLLLLLLLPDVRCARHAYDDEAKAPYSE